MAQEYYSFMSNCFFETLVIQVTLVYSTEVLLFALLSVDIICHLIDEA